jgi:hypothetical protein
VRDRFWIAGPAAAIAASLTAIGLYAADEPPPGWGFYLWPALVILWSLYVVSYRRAQDLNRATIGIQASVIRKQSELLAQIFDDQHD